MNPEVREISQKMAKHEKTIGEVILNYEFCVDFVGESGKYEIRIKMCG